MNNATQHPTSEELDRFRAELLDNETMHSLSAHVEQCARCQQQLSGWEQLRTVAQISAQQQKALEEKLKATRKKALESDFRSVVSRFQPALAVAASLTLLVSLGLWQPWSSVATNPGQMVQLEEEATPELTEDLDFYIWLAGEQESSRSLQNNESVNT